MKDLESLYSEILGAEKFDAELSTLCYKLRNMHGCIFISGRSTAVIVSGK